MNSQLPSLGPGPGEQGFHGAPSSPPKTVYAVRTLLGSDGPGAQLSPLCASVSPWHEGAGFCELLLASEVLGDFTSTTLYHCHVRGCDQHHTAKQDGRRSGLRGSGFYPCSETLSKSLTSLGLNFLDIKMIPMCQALL